jgi:hypothetical protein
VVHKAFASVDEADTETAAATAVMMKLLAAMPEEPVEFTLDHRFPSTLTLLMVSPSWPVGAETKDQGWTSKITSSNFQQSEGAAS